MAKQLFGKNGQPAGGAGGSGGGGGIPYVSIPDIRGGSRVAIGRKNVFDLSALCLLANAHVEWFLVEATGGATGGTIPATLGKDGKNTASVTVTVPADVQVGATIRITVTARDNYGNESLPAEIAVTAATGYVATPVLSAPLPDSDVSPLSFYAVTNAFSVLGDADKQVAAQYLVVTDNEDSEVLYDSGELTEATEFTKHNITIPELVIERAPIIVKARHKGKDNGWSDYSAPVRCYLSSNRLMVMSTGVYTSTVDFDKLTGFSPVGLSLPSKTQIYNMFERDGTFLALTQHDNFWQIYTTTDFNTWDGPYGVGPIVNLSYPAFAYFKGHIFLSGRSVYRSSDNGKTWVTISGVGTSDGLTRYECFCSDDKYCYYTYSRYYSSSSPYSGTTTLYKSENGTSFTSKELFNVPSTTDRSTAASASACGSCGAENGTVLFSTHNSTVILVSNNYGESFDKAIVPSSVSTTSTNFNDRKFIYLGGSWHSVVGVYFTKGSADGKIWPASALNLNFGTIKNCVVEGGKCKLWGTSVGYKESINGTDWVSEGKPLYLTDATSYGYLNTLPKRVLYGPCCLLSSDLEKWGPTNGLEINQDNTTRWYAATYRFGMYIRVGSVQGKGAISTSKDGITWSLPLQNGVYAWRYLFNARDKLIVANEHNNPSSSMCYTVDGVSWSAQIAAGVTGASAFGYANGYYYNVEYVNHSSKALYSLDLSKWINVATSGNVSGYIDSRGILSGPDRIMCVFIYSTTVYTSYVTATSWSAPQSLTGISNSDGTFIAGAYGNNIYMFFRKSSVTLISATGALIGTGTLEAEIKSITFMHGEFYACLVNGRIQKSTTGGQWSIGVQALAQFGTFDPIAVSNS